MITHAFLNENEASRLLTQEDEYTRNVTDFSLQAMGCRNREAHLRLLANVSRNFSNQEQNRITQYMNEINKRLEELNLTFDVHVNFVKTSGQESFGLPYTRQNFVVYTEQFMMAEQRGMRIPNVNMGLGLLAHEVFHVISRQNPELRPALYALHGFRHNPGRVVTPQVITNPDAPNADYTVDLNIGEARPVLAVQGMGMNAMASADKQIQAGNRIIHRDQTNYMQVVRPNSPMNAYHPEEISAENFRLLIEGQAFANEAAFLAALRN